MTGKPLTIGTPTAYTCQDSISSFITDIRAADPGNALHLSILKYNTKTAAEVDIKPLPSDVNDVNSPLSIGVMIAPNYMGNEFVKATNPVDAAVKASNEVAELTAQTARGIFKLLGGFVSSGGKAPAGQSLSGPIGVIKQGSDVVAKNDFTAVLGFAAAISVNLAVVNSLPLPALDGGQLVFVLLEALTGKKVDQKKQEEITSVFLLFLVLVSVGTTVGDVGNLFR
jgi:RIP metalloprotease RseP